MRYIYLANGRVGWEILRWLTEQGQNPAGVVVHPQAKAKYRDELIAMSRLLPDEILEGPKLATQEGVDWVSARKPEWLVSISFGYILKPAVLAVPTKGAINLHPALLPYNRGAYPNVWSIVDRTPAGVTLHVIDPGVDTGDIIAQRTIPVEPTDTGSTLYARLEEASIALFQEAWPALLAGSFQRRPQQPDGTFHRVSDVEQIDRIDPNQQVRAGDLIDIIRARTFPPYKGAYLDLPDRRVYLKLELTEENK
jgi:methionyl-tRNA formyltransferase